jgi:hypothetical protein
MMMMIIIIIIISNRNARIDYNTRYRRENNIILELQEVCCEGLKFTERTHDRFLWWHL